MANFTNSVSDASSIEGFQLNLVYQHKLSRAAFSMCSGPFGGVQNKDYICVQSVDGTLNLFENESFSFSRFLPGFLLPGPIAYVPKTDSFVTISSSYQLESYRLVKLNCQFMAKLVTFLRKLVYIFGKIWFHLLVFVY